MLCFFVIGYLTSWVAAQNGRGPQRFDHSGHGWDIRLAVPGEPGNDYPTLRTIPRTTFSCAGREPGYYADTETNCQVFRVCTVGSTYGFQSFLCPNGTLFNQAVFVCDWWMNVNCEKSQQIVKKNYEQFENLRLGPQLMKDVKKMLTHPMRNPYDKGVMRSNFIVMQDYKPPAGQLFPNGALFAGPERVPNMIYVPKQNLMQNYINNDLTFSASTSLPKFYTSSIFTTIRPTTFRNTEVFNPQGVYGQKSRFQTQNLSTGNLVSNGHIRKYTKFENNKSVDNTGKINIAPQITHRNAQKLQKPSQTNNLQKEKLNNARYDHRGQLSRQNNKYTDFTKPTPLKNTHNQIQINTPKQKYNIDKEKKQNSNQTTFTQAPYELAEEIQNEVKQNVVSRVTNKITPMFSTKTVAYSRIIENPQPGKPKSRITIKTWIIKPTKTAKIIASPSSYNFARIIQLPKAINETSPYFYDKPTTQSPPERIISKPNPTPYTYNRPTISAKQIDSTKDSFTEYNLPLTTTLAPISTPTLKFRPLPTISGRLDIAPTIETSTLPSSIYNEQTTIRPASRLYLPPQNMMISRQYLSPIIQPPVFYPSSPLNDITTSPTPIFVSNIGMQEPVITKLPEQTTSNLSFTDILTKDTLDRTVSSIVKDTNDILKTASPPEFEQYDQRLSNEDDSKTESVTDSGESLTSELPTMASKSARIIAFPSINLEPPDASYNSPNFNKISNLPYFKESLLPPANTIERTVSLRITIPEKLAAYLFRNSNERDYDKLEILNTNGSDYLVLSNDLKTSDPNFIPLGKLIDSKALNISNSQALVFSLLADSINAAKEYSNTAQQEVLSSKSTPTQFQNINNEELSQITDKISQLTAAQFSGTNNRKSNIVPTTHITNTVQGNQLSSNLQYINNQQSTSHRIPQHIQNNFATPQVQDNSNIMNQNQLKNSRLSENLVDNNSNQIYSGQLYQHPVPEVTNQIYNRPFLTNSRQTDGISQNNIPTNRVQQNILTNTIPASLGPPNTIPKYSNAVKFAPPSNMPQRSIQNNILPSNQNNVENLINKEQSFEIIQSQTLPLRSAKVQLEPSNERNSLNHETITNLLNSDNGISAQVLDRIVGTIPHPLENNKLVTYEKDQTYYFTTKLGNSNPLRNSNIKALPTQSNTIEDQNDIGVQNNNAPNKLTFQFIPSVGYELDNENEQHQLLSAFRIDEFGAPRDIVKPNVQGNDQAENIMTPTANFAVDQQKSAKQIDNMSNVNALYSGPSSYLAPQASIGNLIKRQENVQNNFNSRLEDLNGDNEIGYPKTRPARQFFF